MKRQATILRFTCVLAASLTACSAARDAIERHQTAVARVDGHTLTIDHAARLLSFADERIAPAIPVVVDPISDLWVGYTLLASELASPDTFSNLDLSSLTEFAANQELVWRLRQGVILDPLQISDEELRRAYEREQPYTRVQAYQILVRVPETADPQQIDSLRALAESLRERAAAGEDFQELARRYSDDPRTAEEGGALGWVEHGTTPPQTEDVIFRLQPGEVGETVRSPRGYHILKVAARVAPEFAEVAEAYRQALRDEGVAALETAYIDSLFNAANVEYAPGSIARVRRAAIAPQLARATDAQRSAVLVRYRGGELTLGELADHLATRSDRTRQAFAGDSISVRGLLRELVRNELLVKAARDNGFAVPPEVADSLERTAIRELFTAAGIAGFRRQELVDGEQTVSEAVDRIMEMLLTQRRSPESLRRVAPALKQGRAIQYYPDRYPAVIDRLTAIRSGETVETGTRSPGSAE